MKNIEEDENQFDDKEENLIAEVTANKALLEEDLVFDFDSNSESANDSDPKEPESNDLTSSQSSKGSIRPSRK